jgi:hypothetical protein
MDRKQNTEGMENILRAMTSFEAGVSNYTIVDIEDAIALGSDESTPLTRRLRREKKAHTTLFEWLEQYLPAPGTNAQSEGVDPSASSSSKPTRYNNALQIFSKKFEITDTMERIARAGGLVGVQGSELARQMSMLLTQMFLEEEDYFVHGTKSTADPRQMGGLRSFILAQNKVDGAAVQITAANVKSYINQVVAKLVASKAAFRPNAIWCGPAFADVLAEAAGSNVQVTVDLATYKNASPTGVVGSNVGWFKTNYGIMEIVMLPDMVTADAAIDAADSEVLLVHEPSLTVVEYVNGGLEIAERAKTDAKIAKVATEEITLQVQNIRGHGELSNFYV